MSLTSLVMFIELSRFTSLCAIMGYAAFKDWRTGEVSNKIWLYAIVGGFFTVLETIMFFSVGFLILTIGIIALSISIGFLTFLLGGGGADSKALMVLGISAPFVPLWSLIWPLPLPFVTMLFASVAVLPYFFLKKSDVPVRKRKIRFLPFMFLGLVICVIL
jgi:Flp pilus assembly protein protease CpaA